jgi:hypothetical protein
MTRKSPTVQLGKRPCRYLAAEGEIWLVTADANKAADFKGETTALDKLSLRLDKLAVHENFMDVGFPRHTLMISLPDLFKAIGRSSKGNLVQIQQQIFGLAAHSLKQKLHPQRLALPSGDEQIDNLSSAAVKQVFAIAGERPSRDLINLPEWLTVRELISGRAETPEKALRLLNHTVFKRWFAAQLAEIYRAENGESPPKVRRGKGSVYCYPPAYKATAEQYMKNWKGVTA